MNINEPPAATQPHFPYKSICTHKLQTTRVKMNREEEGKKKKKIKNHPSPGHGQNLRVFTPGSIKEKKSGSSVYIRQN